MGATLTAVYGDGWDDAVVNPLTRTAASERHAAGEPYSVVLLVEGRPDSPPPRLPVPGFGEWQPLLELAGDGRPAIVDATAHDLPVRDGVRPWQPPRALRPSGIDGLFTDGTERAVGERAVRASTHPAGPLHLPSGRMVAADPSSLDFGEEPFTVTVEPGRYPVTIGLATFTGDRGHRRVAAARLEIAVAPVVTWELALRAGQDQLDLGVADMLLFGA